MAHLQAMRQRRSSVQPQDVLVSGVETATDIGGGLIRIEYYINRVGADGRITRTAHPRALVIPIEAVPDAIGKTMMALGRKVIAREGELVVAH